MRPAFATISSVVRKPKLVVPDLPALEEILGYKFRERALLERAITHRSWAHECVGPGKGDKARRLHNEALEFVGDSVLGLIVADYLFKFYPTLSEGELSRMKHQLVSASTLAEAAERLRLGDFIRLGYGEEKTGGRRKPALLADAFEAVLAAIFIDGGFDEAVRYVHRSLSSELASAATAIVADHKTLLQERLQAEGRSAPHYAVIETEGPPHCRVFRVEAIWDAGSAHGEGRTIKAAETDAARRALLMVINADAPQTETVG